MAHFELDVESSESCTGTQGSYVGNLYHTAPKGQHLRLTRAKLGGFNAALNDPVTTIQRARHIAETQEGINIPFDRIAALGVMRLCFRRRHVDVALAVGQVPSLERVASLAVAHTLDDIEEIKPLKGDVFEFDPEGVGAAERQERGMSAIRSLIHLPTSPMERRNPDYRITTAVRSSAISRGMSDKPYVALHGQDGLHLEQIVPLKDLLQ